VLVRAPDALSTRDEDMIAPVPPGQFRCRKVRPCIRNTNCPDGLQITRMLDLFCLEVLKPKQWRCIDLIERNATVSRRPVVPTGGQDTKVRAFMCVRLGPQEDTIISQPIDRGVAVGTAASSKIDHLSDPIG
jgi:hypothetical protein